MSDEYLWNREGEPDEEVVRLEQLLGGLRYQGKKPALTPPGRRLWWLAAAAALVGTLSGGVFLASRGTQTSWQLADGSRIRTGQLVSTGSATGLRLDSQSVGQVDLEPNSKLRMVRSQAGEHAFHLESGTIHALIWAPPGKFTVDTPSAKAIDLGCRYTLQVSENGDGLVSVETGWVAFEWQNTEAFIPAGAECRTRRGRGPGTPWFGDAPAEFKKAVAAFDMGRGADSLAAVLRTAREQDALTLWHLLRRTQGAQRAQVFKRFAGLVKLPAVVTEEAVLRGDAEAVDASWNALGLGSTEWWRDWKRKW